MRRAATAMWLSGCDGQTEPPVEYRGPNAAEHFFKVLQEEERKIKTVLANPKVMQMTREDGWTHKSTTTCHACEKPLEGDSVRDHCHVTGEYHGAAHNACNLKLLLSPKTANIPVVFHNLRGYLPPADAGNLKGRGSYILYPQQHGEVHLLLSGSAPLYRQCPVPTGIPWPAGGGQQARDL